MNGEAIGGTVKRKRERERERERSVGTRMSEGAHTVMDVSACAKIKSNFIVIVTHFFPTFIHHSNKSFAIDRIIDTSFS
jgi:hypothetical protein